MGCTNRIVELNQDENSTLVCEFTVEDINGNPVDVTGIEFTFTGKNNASDDDADAVWMKSVIGSGTNPVNLSVSSIGIPVGTYRYDITGEQLGQREVYENEYLIINETVRGYI